MLVIGKKINNFGSMLQKELAKTQRFIEAVGIAQDSVLWAMLRNPGLRHYATAENDAFGPSSYCGACSVHQLHSSIKFRNIYS